MARTKRFEIHCTLVIVLTKLIFWCILWNSSIRESRSEYVNVHTCTHVPNPQNVYPKVRA